MVSGSQTGEKREIELGDHSQKKGEKLSGKNQSVPDFGRKETK